MKPTQIGMILFIIILIVVAAVGVYLNSEISTLSSSYNSIASKYNSLKSEVSGVVNSYNDIKSNYTTLSSNYAALVSYFSKLESYYEGLNKSFYGNKSLLLSELNMEAGYATAYQTLEYLASSNAKGIASMFCPNINGFISVGKLNGSFTGSTNVGKMFSQIFAYPIVRAFLCCGAVYNMSPNAIMISALVKYCNVNTTGGTTFIYVLYHVTLSDSSMFTWKISNIDVYNYLNSIQYQMALDGITYPHAMCSKDTPVISELGIGEFPSYILVCSKLPIAGNYSVPNFENELKNVTAFNLEVQYYNFTAVGNSLSGIIYAHAEIAIGNNTFCGEVKIMEHAKIQANGLPEIYSICFYTM
ncbi:hypothetical protein [Acidianus sp. HS-5]|uniref:hypothetical protein n=1 Tax=Acidianus sp. HS-5 TaxID=2886040 RepID=UPI001F2E46C4|nr:hypothetical protein [Acidianus sp. HS-5]BDC18553.1 hypothetical protein HS5_14430 [Acidianus sp. HS-5]